MTHQSQQSQQASLPAALADVALIDARTSAATGGMGISWWHARVAAGEAPRPVIQQPRMTRWRLADVRAFWAQRAQAGSAGAGEHLQAQTSKASAAAARNRNGKTATSTNAG
jgi:predicted DNA-binding transcriptional regulator AlpA